MQHAGVYDASVMSVDNNEIIQKVDVSRNCQIHLTLQLVFVDMPNEGNLSVKVFDVNGRMVKEIINTYVNSGRILARWSGKNEFDVMSPTGIYFLRVETSINHHVQKLALVK